jgi:outer membrane protein TolC
MPIARVIFALCCISIAWGWHCPSRAQLPITEPNPSQVLGLSEYVEYVQAYHPVLKQAALLPQQARHYLREARGAFDPSLAADFNRKVLAGKVYYDNFYSTLKIPTLPGLNLVAGYESSTGRSTSPETRTGSAGLAFAGIEVPIGGQLIFDERRNALRQAQLLPQLASAEQQKVVIKLWAEALKAYLAWQSAYFAQGVQRQGLQLAQQRLEWVRARALVGELAVIDTLEAYLEVQRRLLLSLEADVDLVVATRSLANFLWTPDGQPQDIPPAWVPEAQAANSNLPALDELVTRADSLHPELAKLRLKQQQLEWERRFTFWQTMPTVRIGYRPIVTPVAGALDDFSAAFLQENYKFGLGFYIPIPGRKNIAKYNLSRLKVQFNELETNYTRLSVRTSIEAEYTRAQQYALLAATQATMTANAETMRQAEETRFQIGESSLFILNTRERYVLEAQLKLVQLREKQLKAVVELYLDSGQNPLQAFGF